MTILEVLLLLVVIFGVGLVAYWIIRKFIPAEAQTVALAIVGVLLLVVLLVAFFPGAGSYRIWK
jgi:hypothetical protein